RDGEYAPARPDQPFPLAGGQGDPGLAETGRFRAEPGAQGLADQRFDAAYDTPLRGAAPTAAPLLAESGIEAVAEPDMREAHLGECEGGVYRQKLAEGDPLVKQLLAEQRWDVIPGAEDPELLRERVTKAIGRIAADHPDQRVAVFTHGGIIGEVLALASGSRPFSFLSADNGSISQVVVTGSNWFVRRFNDTAHLAGIPTG